MHAHTRTHRSITPFSKEERGHVYSVIKSAAVVYAATQYRDISYDTWVELSEEVLVDAFRRSYVTKQVLPPMRGHR